MELSITLEGFTPVSVSYDNGATYEALDTLNNLDAGTYSIWLKDASDNVIKHNIVLDSGIIETICIKEINCKVTETLVLTCEIECV